MATSEAELEVRIAKSLLQEGQVLYLDSVGFVITDSIGNSSSWIISGCLSAFVTFGRNLSSYNLGLPYTPISLSFPHLHLDRVLEDDHF